MVGNDFLLLANSGYAVGRHDFAAPYLNGIMYESGWSHERTEWDDCIAKMRHTESLLRKPTISVIERFENTGSRSGWPGDPNRGKKPPAVPQARRWSLCFALTVGDFYYLFADNTSHQHDWYPEYDVKIGLPTGGATVTSASVVNTTDAGNHTANDTANDTARPDQSARLQEVLKPLVDDGTLSQAQADTVVETLAAAGPMGGGHGGRGGARGLGIVATTLGMTEAEVRDAISNGQTLAQLAEAKGSSGQALIDAILAELKAHLDEEVAAGEHTQAEADAKLAEATTRVTELVNNTDAALLAGPGGPRRHGPRGHAPRAAKVTGQGVRR